MNAKSIEVRLATPADEVAASQLAEQVYARFRNIYQPTAVARANAGKLQPQLQRLVAFDGDRIVGTVKFYFEAATLRLIGLAVDDECRNRGVARKLIDELTRQAILHDAKTMTAWTVPAAGAVPFYEKLGFQVVKEADEGYFESPEGKPMPEVLMERTVGT